MLQLTEFSISFPPHKSFYNLIFYLPIIKHRLSNLKEPPEVFEFFNHSKILDFQRQYIIADFSEILDFEERFKEIFITNGNPTTSEQSDSQTRIIRSDKAIKAIVYSFQKDRHLIYFYGIDEEF